MTKQICYNRTARFEYFIEDRYEAGIVLEGAEVKSLRMGNCNISDSFCVIRAGEVWLKNMHIGWYARAGAFNAKDTRRDRKLLLRKSEISRIAGKVNEKGMTLVPLSLYFKDNLVKVELGLCRGKHTYDKKRVISERDTKRQLDREMKEFRRR